VNGERGAAFWVVDVEHASRQCAAVSDRLEGVLPSTAEVVGCAGASAEGSGG
jgi:hypothetical protein